MSVKFPVHISDFIGARASLNTPASSPPQDFTWSAILRAAMVAGYSNFAAIPSHQFLRWRTAALRLAVRCSNGRLTQPPEWKQFDPSEKAAVSSVLGVIVTKLLVERLLNAPLLLFLDVHFKVTFPPGVPKIRPDFVALTPADEWFSVEAKGRSQFRQTTLDKGKGQANALGVVNGRPVEAGVVCVTSFSNGKLKARFDDPPPKDKAATLKVDPMHALKSYYGRFERFQKFSERMGEVEVPNEGFRVQLWYSEELDVRFGILPDLETALTQRSPEQALAVLKRLADPEVRINHPSLGPDGIVVIPGSSWKEE